MSVVDLKQFYPTFFAESLSGLDKVEAELLHLEQDPQDVERMHAIFRAIHSIKGASGTFGFDDIGELSHEMETLLDEMRNGKSQASQQIVDTLLKSVDCLRRMLLAAQAGHGHDLEESTKLQQRLQALRQGTTTGSQPAVAQPVQRPAGRTRLLIRFRPHSHFFKTGNDVLRLFRVLEKMGNLKVKGDANTLPDFEKLDPEASYLAWELELETAEPRTSVEEAFAWVVDDCDLEIQQLEDVEDRGQAETALPSTNSLAPSIPRIAPVYNESLSPEPNAMASGSVYVDTRKLDDLVNITGELVITQTVLKQVGDNLDNSKLAELQTALLQLENNIRDLQQSVMSIRMLPVSFAFNRFARVVRDVSHELGKKVELKISGEHSELDKTMIEKLIDPLTHLVRNSLDHGIESPEERIDAGKPETGTLWLHAEHKGGNIIIQVRDDGRGLNREKIFAKAADLGLVEPDKTLSPEQIDQMIFLPGFSTVDVVSDISGRGVGMDVVRRNILSLGGSVEVFSEAGKGIAFTIRLPLTLAILDGMSIAVGQELFILPVAFIVEAIQPTAASIKTISGKGKVVDVRGEYLPLVILRDLLAIDSPGSVNEGIIVLVEVEGRRIAMFVDALLGQHQVLVKSLESNYRKIPHASGATILGNGRVALILDVNSLVRIVQGGPQVRIDG